MDQGLTAMQGGHIIKALERIAAALEVLASQDGLPLDEAIDQGNDPEDHHEYHVENGIDHPNCSLCTPEHRVPEVEQYEDGNT